MLQYPSIPGFGDGVRQADRRGAPILGEDCLAFVKYDGSNLRWEWSPKSGWSKFGTRKQLFDASTAPWSSAIPLFMDTMASELERRGKDLGGKKLERMTVFTQFFGPSSFAGQHDWSETHELRLFDVFLFKKGFVPPEKFVEVYGNLPYTAEVMYKGPLSHELQQQVHAGVFPVQEGVICKGTSKEFSVKLKTSAWFEKLKEKFVDWESMV